MITKEIIHLHATCMDLLRQKLPSLNPPMSSAIEGNVERDDAIKELVKMSLEEWEGNVSGNASQSIEFVKLLVRGLEQMAFSNKKFREEAVEQML